MSKKQAVPTNVLDIIVTHYKEPWSLGEKLFSILDLQRGVNFDDIRVLLIHDGTEPFPAETFAGRPYTVEQFKIPHGGISAARNAGIRLSAAPWIMFCDFDDTFSNVYALRDYLTIIPNDKYDMIWAPFYAEDVTKEGKLILHERGQNVVFVHGKLYRRQYLIETGLRFPEDLEFNEDSCFNAILNTICDYRRIGAMKAPMIPYIWAFNPNSLTTTRGNRWKALRGLYERNKKVVACFRKEMDAGRISRDRYCAMVARACVDAYYMLCLTEIPPEIQDLRDDFVKFYHEHRSEMWETDTEMLRKVKAISRAEHETGDQEEKDRLGELAVEIPRADKTVTQWLSEIWQEGEQAPAGA